MKYFTENSSIADGAIASEVRRYITSAGQATAYKIGMIKLQQMRDKARTRAETRLLIMGMAFFVAFSTIGARMGLLAATEPEEPRASAPGAEIIAQRADITDRNGRILATNMLTHALYVQTKDLIDPARVARELAVQTSKALEENAASAKPKPEAVIQNNIIPGRMKKFFEESTLLNQKFVINPDITVAQAAKDAGVEIVSFVRMAVGEGIEKEKEDFAAEVAKALQG